MRKETSDLYFNADTVSTFFSDYPVPNSLDQETFEYFADMYFCLDSYDYVWLYREFKHQFVSQGIDHIFKPENTVPIANKFIEIYKDKIPDLLKKKIEVYSHFKNFLSMTDQELAEYCINLLGGINLE